MRKVPIYSITLFICPYRFYSRLTLDVRVYRQGPRVHCWPLIKVVSPDSCRLRLYSCLWATHFDSLYTPWTLPSCQCLWLRKTRHKIEVVTICLNTRGMILPDTPSRSSLRSLVLYSLPLSTISWIVMITKMRVRTTGGLSKRNSRI